MSTRGAAAKKTSTYRKIATRLAKLNPPIDLTDHIVSESKLEAHENTLDGINLVPKKTPSPRSPPF